MAKCSLISFSVERVRKQRIKINLNGHWMLTHKKRSAAVIAKKRVRERKISKLEIKAKNCE